MAKEDFMSFEEVLSELQVSDEELQKMVSDGKVRAIRAKRTLKFRRTDIQSLKSERQTEQTLIVAGDDDDAPTLLEVPPAGETQEIKATPMAMTADPSPGDTAEQFGIEAAPAPTDEDEIGTELNFEEIPLGDTQELPSAAGPPPVVPAQDTTDTDLNLDELEVGTPEADDVTDTVIPTIELGKDDDVPDDTTDTVIPTIELSADDDLSDDTSDTVIPTIELSADENQDEGTDTAFPTIELSDDEDIPDVDVGGSTADLTLDEFEETAQDEEDDGLGLETATQELTFEATETEEDIPTFGEADEFVDTQQETSAVESPLGFEGETEAATGAETAPLEGEAAPAGAGEPEMIPAAAAVAVEAPVALGFGTVLMLVPTLAAAVLAGVILTSAITIASDSFQSPDYLDGIMKLVREQVYPHLP